MLKFVFLQTEDVCLREFGSCLKEVKPLVVYDGEQGIVLEPMQGNWA